jgi:hypothetical protein
LTRTLLLLYGPRSVPKGIGTRFQAVTTGKEERQFQTAFGDFSHSRPHCVLRDGELNADFFEKDELLLFKEEKK